MNNFSTAYRPLIRSRVFTMSTLYGHFCKIHRITASASLLIYVMLLFAAQ
ncbi:MAG: hypothetical protein ACOVOW_01590 [Spirosomataceae bacterium]